MGGNRGTGTDGPIPPPATASSTSSVSTRIRPRGAGGRLVSPITPSSSRRDAHAPAPRFARTLPTRAPGASYQRVHFREFAPRMAIHRGLAYLCRPPAPQRPNRGKRDLGFCTLNRLRSPKSAPPSMPNLYGLPRRPEKVSTGAQTTARRARRARCAPSGRRWAGSRDGRGGPSCRRGG